MKSFNTLQTPTTTRINVTPIIDVALVLVIILLVTAPILAAIDLGIDLPEARAQAIEESRTLCITLGKEGQVAIGEELVPRQQFSNRLSARIEEEGGEGLLVVVRADAGSSHAAVRDLLLQVRDAGATRIGIGTRHKSEDD